MLVILFRSPEMIIFPSIKATFLLVVRMVFLVVSFDPFIKFLPQFAKRSSQGSLLRFDNSTHRCLFPGLKKDDTCIGRQKRYKNNWSTADDVSLDYDDNSDSCMTLAGFASVWLECHAQPVPMTKVIQQTALVCCVINNILLARFSDGFSHSSSMIAEFQIRFQSFGDMIGKMSRDS